MAGRTHCLKTLVFKHCCMDDERCVLILKLFELPESFLFDSGNTSTYAVSSPESGTKLNKGKLKMIDGK